MALQGTLDTFALPDVLRLLAATAKSGRLLIDGDRGVGDVWLDQGEVVGGSVNSTTLTSSDVVFELLRHDEGSFEFVAGESGSDPQPPTEVEQVIAAAEAKLVEWRVVEEVVPSLQCQVRLAEDLPSSEVTLTSKQWKVLTAIGEGRSVDEVDKRLLLGEIGVSEAVKALIDDQLVTLDIPAEVDPGLEQSGSAEDSSPEVQDVVGQAEAEDDRSGNPIDSSSMTEPPVGSSTGGSWDVDLDNALGADSSDHAYLTNGFGDSSVDGNGSSLPEELPDEAGTPAHAAHAESLVSPEHSERPEEPLNRNGLKKYIAS